MKKLSLTEEVMVYEYRPVILDVRTPSLPILGLWVKTWFDATYLVIGQFHHRIDVEFPQRNEGTWITLKDLRSRAPVGWPPESKPTECAFMVEGVSLADPSAKIRPGVQYFHRPEKKR